MITTHNARVSFGRWKGELLTRVPVSYLRWAVCNQVDARQPLPDCRPVPLIVDFHEACTLELDRRGERVQDVEISGHAVDRCTSSDYLWGIYQANRIADQGGHGPEGLFQFLERCTEYLARMDDGIGTAMEQARLSGDEDGHQVKVRYLGADWVIQVNLALPVLLTVIPK